MFLNIITQIILAGDSEILVAFHVSTWVGLSTSVSVLTEHVTLSLCDGSDDILSNYEDKISYKDCAQSEHVLSCKK